MFRVFILNLFLTLIVFNAASQTSLIDSIITQVRAEHLVKYLSSDSLRGRLTGTFEAKTAAEFIAGEFTKAGAQPGEGDQGYLVPFTFPGKFKEDVVGYNVISVLPGKSRQEEIIIFSAHYDHVGTLSTTPIASEEEAFAWDSIYNGANDNASGTAAIILLAHYFAAMNNNERTIMFIAFSGEEFGLKGSRALSNEMKPGPIKALINIEMIGRKQGRQMRPFITGSNLSNLKTLLNNRLATFDEAIYGKAFFRNDPYGMEKLFRRSDNWNFAVKGVTAHTIMLTSPLDKYYHTTDDEAGTLDYDIMTRLIQAIALSCTDLVQGSSTPARINQKKL